MQRYATTAAHSTVNIMYGTLFLLGDENNSKIRFPCWLDTIRTFNDMGSTISKLWPLCRCTASIVYPVPPGSFVAPLRMPPPHTFCHIRLASSAAIQRGIFLSPPCLSPAISLSPISRSGVKKYAPPCMSFWHGNSQRNLANCALFCASVEPFLRGPVKVRTCILVISSEALIDWRQKRSWLRTLYIVNCEDCGIP